MLVMGTLGLKWQFRDVRKVWQVLGWWMADGQVLPNFSVAHRNGKKLPKMLG